MIQKARPETREFILACDELLSEEDAEFIRASAMFYILDGWEEYWPFPRMPRWLQGRYWSPELVGRLRSAAEMDAQRLNTPPEPKDSHRE